MSAEAAIESLAIAAPDLVKQLDGPRKRSRERAAKIAERWYAESADPAADPWKGIYHATKMSHADLAKSPILPVPKGQSAVDPLPWGPSGSLYRIVPGFRGLFAETGSAKDRFGDDLFRRIAYRLVALQDPNGQWSGAGNYLLSTASESLTMQRIANTWHRALSRDPPGKIGVPDPVPYEAMLRPESLGWISHQAARPDAAVFPTLASLLFLLEAIDTPVSLDGITILPEAQAEPSKDSADTPPPRLSPIDAVRRVARPSGPREDLFTAIIATRWPRTTAAAAPAAATAAASASAAKPVENPAKDAAEEDEGLGKFEDLLAPSGAVT